MARTVLQTVQRVCQRLAIPQPSALVTSTDPQVIQLRVIMEDVLTEAMVRWNWEQLSRRATFFALATASQGTLESLTGTSFVKINNNTLWDLTRKCEVEGPTSERMWQYRQAVPMSGPVYQYQIREGQLFLDPVPTAGAPFSFFWTSNLCFSDSTGATKRASIEQDDDLCLFPDNFLYAGLLYGWKQEKGLPYAEDLRTWELLAISHSNASGTRRVLNLDPRSSEML